MGGGVRDLLLGEKPKTLILLPMQRQKVRRLFRNSRLVGRRFRLAHIMFGPEVIEVATSVALMKIMKHPIAISHNKHKAVCCATISSDRLKKMPFVGILP